MTAQALIGRDLPLAPPEVGSYIILLHQQIVQKGSLVPPQATPTLEQEGLVFNVTHVKPGIYTSEVEVI